MSIISWIFISLKCHVLKIGYWSFILKMSSSEPVSSDVSLVDIATVLKSLDEKIVLLITKVDALAEFMEEDIDLSDDEVPAPSPPVANIPPSKVGISSLSQPFGPGYIRSSPALRRLNSNFGESFPRRFGPLDDRYNPYKRRPPFQS